MVPDGSRSRVPYRVRGRAMRPVHWSLKNQWTAPAEPIADILRRVGISVCVPATPRAPVCMLLARIQLPTAVAAFRGVGRRHLLNHDTGHMGLVGDELFQLKNGQ